MKMNRKVQYSERCTIMDGQRAGSHAIATCIMSLCFFLRGGGGGGRNEVSGDSAILDA